jgi:hypothetical protein
MIVKVKATVLEFSKVSNIWGMGKISKTKLISKSDTVRVTSKENESSFSTLGFVPLSRQCLWAVRITDATEDGEVTGKQETGGVTNAITNIVDEDIE